MNITTTHRQACGNALPFLYNVDTYGQSTRLIMICSSKHNYQNGSMKPPSHFALLLKLTAK